MKRLLKILGWVVGCTALLCVLLLVTGNAHVLRGLRSTYFIGESRPDIDDERFHDLRKVASGETIPWLRHAPLVALNAEDIAFHDSIESVGFIVIHQGEIIAEQYFEGANAQSRYNSFSMAKSFLAMAFGAALENGDLASLDLRLGEVLPEYNSGLDSLITIRHLLQMSSGIDFGESYANPFGYQAKAYFGRDLESLTRPYRATSPPGTFWKYEGGNTVLLSLVLKELTGETLSDYFSKNIWQQIGAEQEAFWNLDREGGLEKSFSAFYATATDFARVGQLYMDSGRVGNRQLIPESFIEESIRPVKILNEEGEPEMHYGLHWWLGTFDGQPFYSCRGMRGQYIACVPHLNMIMVRLGHNRIEEYVDGASLDLYRLLDMGKSKVEDEGRH